MRALVVLLRKNGVPRAYPHTGKDGVDMYPPEWVSKGLLEFGAALHRGGRGLMLVAYNSTPGTGVIHMLHQPTIAGVTSSGFRFRGFEAVATPDGQAGVMQEWMVFPD